MANSRSRKYQLTLNNPLEHGYSHQHIKECMEEIKYIYFCMSDEIGAEEQTPHTHLYFVCENAIHFDRIKKLFPTAHIEKALGSSQENRDYIRKEGKYLNSDKKETNLPDTFEEYGEMPLDKSAKNETISEQVLEMLEDGNSITDIIKRFPSYTTKINQLEKARQLVLEEKYRDWRDVEVTYISGETATGKTRYVMDTYGYPNVYKITNYKNPFDNYNGQDVILFDEFRSSLPLADMLQYLDGYPCRLPARFADKAAVFTKAFIVSNIDLDKQYPNIQIEDKLSWNAFIRRINNVKKFIRNNGELPFASDDEIITLVIMRDNYLK